MHPVLSENQHNHESDPVHITEVSYRNALKRRAVEDSSVPLKNFRTETTKIPNSVHQRVSMNIQRKLVRKARDDSVATQTEGVATDVDEALQLPIMTETSFYWPI